MFSMNPLYSFPAPAGPPAPPASQTLPPHDFGIELPEVTDDTLDLSFFNGGGADDGQHDDHSLSQPEDPEPIQPLLIQPLFREEEARMDSQTTPARPIVAMPARPAPRTQGHTRLTSSFIIASQRVQLDDLHHSSGLRYCDAIGTVDSTVADLVHRLELDQLQHKKLDKILQRLEDLEKNKKKQADDKERYAELREWLGKVSVKVAAESDLGAYTAVLDANKQPIRKALTTEIWCILMARPQAWRDTNLGPNYVAPQPWAKKTKKSNPVRDIVGEKAKAARYALQGTILQYVPLPDSPPVADLPVQHIETVIYNVRKVVLLPKTATAPLSKEEVVALTNHAQYYKVAFLRAALLDFHFSPGHPSKLTPWQFVDAKLADLNARTPRYRLCYAVLVLEDDHDRFDGKRHWAQVVALMEATSTTWALPSEAPVDVMVAAYQERFGDRPAPLEDLY